MHYIAGNPALFINAQGSVAILTLKTGSIYVASILVMKF